METLVYDKKLQVLSPPEVLDMEKRVVAGGSGLLAELSCTIAGDPRPKVSIHFTSNAGANQATYSDGLVELLVARASCNILVAMAPYTLLIIMAPIGFSKHLAPSKQLLAMAPSKLLMALASYMLFITAASCKLLLF